MKKIRTKIYLVILSTFLTACYTFNPAKSSPLISEFKTFSVAIFVDEGGSPAYLPNKITEKLSSYFQQNTRLILVKNNADLVIDGKITGYTTSPNAIGSDSRATSNRLTVSISVNGYNNLKSEDVIKNQSFSQFQEYPVNQPLPSVENTLNEDITDKLVIDVFNGIFTW